MGAITLSVICNGGSETGSAVFLYWTHRHLFNIDGFIVYDHIGEGRYDETEQEIQKALKERKAVRDPSLL
jgi:hypothetical protein